MNRSPSITFPNPISHSPGSVSPQAAAPTHLQPSPNPALSVFVRTHTPPPKKQSEKIYKDPRFRTHPQRVFFAVFPHPKPPFPPPSPQHRPDFDPRARKTTMRAHTPYTSPTLPYTPQPSPQEPPYFFLFSSPTTQHHVFGCP